MFDTAIAGSLPKPAWLAETQKLWPQWRSQGSELLQAKADATLLWIKLQEDAGLDTVADRFYGSKRDMAMAFAELLNSEALALQADGVDIIQFDEPAFNVHMQDAADWGVNALERAAQGLTCTTAVHICYGYGIKANLDWKETLGQEWRQYEAIFPALARQRYGAKELVG
jgi:methionine synthase II (cobalamin-independent)